MSSAQGPAYVVMRYLYDTCIFVDSEITQITVKHAFIILESSNLKEVLQLSLRSPLKAESLKVLTPDKHRSITIVTHAFWNVFSDKFTTYFSGSTKAVDLFQ